MEIDTSNLVNRLTIASPSLRLTPLKFWNPNHIFGMAEAEHFKI